MSLQTKFNIPPIQGLMEINSDCAGYHAVPSTDLYQLTIHSEV
jgi:hypothetical protein